MKRNHLGLVAASVAVLAGLAISGTAHATDPSKYFQFSISPTVVVPGQEMTVIASCMANPESNQVDSDGWVVGKNQYDEPDYHAGDHPGRYAATFYCAPGLVQTDYFTIVCPPGSTETGVLPTTPPATTTTTTARPTSTTAPPTSSTTAPPSTTTTTSSGTTATQSAAIFSNTATCVPDKQTAPTSGITPGGGHEVTITPKGPPQTGGGGMAAVVETWHVGQN